MERELGIAVGLLVGLAVGIALVALLFRKRVLDCTFDERQERARGVAFKYGFFTLLISVFLYGCSELILGRWCDALTGVTLCASIALCVFAVTCILKDAYLSLREKPRHVMTLFTVIAAANIVIGAVHILDGDMVENGILTFRCTNLVLGIMTAVILAVYIVNHLLREREEGAE